MSCRSQKKGARQGSSEEAGGPGISHAHLAIAASGSIPPVCAAPDGEAAAELVAAQPLAHGQMPTHQAGRAAGCFKPAVHWPWKVQSLQIMAGLCMYQRRERLCLFSCMATESAFAGA